VVVLTGLLAVSLTRSSAQGETRARWTATTRHLVVGGLTREYHVTRPIGRHGPLPVIVVLHGRGMTPATMQAVSGFQAAAGPAILVYPAGYELSWNAGSCCGAAHLARVDDETFLRTVVHHVLDDEPAADAHAVVLVGYSNGGRMALRMACTDPALFAAVVTVEATPVSPCPRLATPVSMLLIGSSGDPSLSIRSPQPPRTVGGLPQPYLDDVAATWAALDGCRPVSVTHTTTTLDARRWGTCSGGSTVQEDVYTGGSHAWPSGDTATPSAQAAAIAFFDTVHSGV
jgi:polyhydroxybutyrate depolymerase